MAASRAVRTASRLVAILAIGAPAVLVFQHYSIPVLSRAGLWTTCALLLLPLLCWYIWACLVFPFYFSPLRHLPQPPGRSIVTGHAMKLISEPFGTSFRAWVNDIPHDGLILLLDFFNQETLFVVGPAALADVLVHKCYDFEKPYHFRRGGLRIFGEGILLAEGDVHKKQRKNLMPAFTFRAIKNFYPMFWAKTKDMVQAIIENYLSVSSSDRPEEIEVEVIGWASRAVLDIIGVSALGLELNSVKDPDAELSGIYRRIFAPTKAGMALDFITLFTPLWLTDLIPIQRNRDFRRNVEIIKESVHSQVTAHAQKPSIKELTSPDITSVAIDSGYFTENEIVEQMMTFLVAGHETTATALTWAIYLLCKHPEIQTRLRDELAAASLPSATDIDSNITSASIDSLPYLSAVCNETLRLYPPVAMTVRAASRDTTILNHPIPKGTVVVLPPWAVNTSVELWGPDAAEFNPERWLGPGKANSGGAESNYAFLTFLHGPRSCIGQSFAKAEFMCLLAGWVGAFETRLKNAEKEVKIDITGGISVKPKGGLWVKVRPLIKDQNGGGD